MNAKLVPFSDESHLIRPSKSILGDFFCVPINRYHTKTRALAHTASREFFFMRPTVCERCSKCLVISFHLSRHISSYSLFFTLCSSPNNTEIIGRLLCMLKRRNTRTYTSTRNETSTNDWRSFRTQNTTWES